MAKDNNLYLGSGDWNNSTKVVKVVLATDKQFFATGSAGGSKGFIIGTNANVATTLISPYYGGIISGTDLAVGTQYNIAVEQVSGSAADANVYVLY